MLQSPLAWIADYEFQSKVMPTKWKCRVISTIVRSDPAVDCTSTVLLISFWNSARNYYILDYTNSWPLSHLLPCPRSSAIAISLAAKAYLCLECRRRHCLSLSYNMPVTMSRIHSPLASVVHRGLSQFCYFFLSLSIFVFIRHISVSRVNRKCGRRVGFLFDVAVSAPVSPFLSDFRTHSCTLYARLYTLLSYLRENNNLQSVGLDCRASTPHLSEIIKEKNTASWTILTNAKMKNERCERCPLHAAGNRNDFINGRSSRDINIFAALEHVYNAQRKTVDTRHTHTHARLHSALHQITFAWNFRSFEFNIFHFLARLWCHRSGGGGFHQPHFFHFIILITFSFILF